MTAYCTEVQVETFLQMSITGESTPTTTELATFIDIADDLIDRLTGTTWDETTVTDEYYDGDGEAILILDNYPITSITTVHENTAGLGATPSWSARTEGEANDFLLYKDEGYIHFHDNIPARIRHNLKISYKYGYATTPSHISHMSVLLVSILVVQAVTAPEALDNLRGYSLLDLKVFKHGVSPKIQAYWNEFNRLLKLSKTRGVFVVV